MSQSFAWIRERVQGFKRPAAERAASDNLRRDVLRLGLPAVTERILTVTVNVVNTMLVGHLGAAALAATGLSGSIEMIGSTLFQAVATGTTALVAQATGAKNKSLAQQVLEQSMLVAIAMGLICLVVMMPFCRVLLVLLGAEEETANLGARYLPYMVGTFPLFSLLTVGNAALRGAGDTRTPMYVMGLMNVLNVILSLILIRGLGPIPEMGVEGAGIAAGTARGVSGLVVIGLLLSGRGRMQLTRILARPNRDVLNRLLQVGLPAGGENMFMRVAFLTYTKAIASLGTVAYAAHVVAQRVENISMMPAFGFAVAATTLCGQAVGAGDTQRARQAVFRSIEIAVAFTATCGLVFALFPRFMFGLFTSDQAVIEIGILPLQMLALSQPIMTMASCLSGGLRGAGDTRSTMWVTGVGGWIVRIPLTILSATVFKLGLPGVQGAMILDWVVRTALYWWRFRPATWALRAEKAAAAVRGPAKRPVG